MAKVSSIPLLSDIASLNYLCLIYKFNYQYEFSEISTGKYSLKLEMLLHYSKTIGGAGPHPTFVQWVGWGPAPP
jgi:hypothetical protein